MTNSLPPSRSAANRVSDAKNALPTDPALLAVATRLLQQATEVDDIGSLLQAGFSGLTATLGVDYVALAAPVAGRWSVVGEWGTAKSLPTDLLADVLDRDTVQSKGDWLAAPLAPRTAEGEVLAVHFTPSPPAPLPKGEGRREAAIEQLVPVVHQAITSVRRRASQERRLRRLEAILEIANQWNQTHEVQPLLVQMAEAATRLLKADRASIFLWDRPNHMLVGRPALGLPDGELRIPDDRGVVGQVIQTGQPRRADTATEPAAIDRHVDAQLHYQTRTLLCVPLRSHFLRLVD